MKVKRDKKKYLLLLLLILGIGFAAVSVTLVITGTVNIKSDTDDFEANVTFNSVSVDEASDAAGTIASLSADKKTITFTTHALKEIGETVILSYDIINNSQYNASIGTLSCSYVKASGEQDEDIDWDDYLTISPSNNLNGTTLAKANTSSMDEITITMKKSYAGESGVSSAQGESKSYQFNCSFDVTALES